MSIKQFVASVEEIEFEEERERKILALMEAKDGKPGLSRADAEAEVDDSPYIEFDLVHFEGYGEDRKEIKRTLRAYTPTDGQLAFMMAALGRGQSDESRFAAIINIMMETLRDADKDYFEGRLLTRDRQRRLPPKQIEGVFEYLAEQWFANPTQPSSDSAESSRATSR